MSGAFADGKATTTKPGTGARGHAIVDLPSATVLPAGLSDASQE
jgi:hypothetical protein